MEGNTERRANQPKLPNGSLDFSEELDSMSASQLAQAMEDALEDMTEETYDEALISAYLDALDQKAPMPDMPDTDEAWSAFQKKVEDASLVVGGSSPKRPARFRRVVRTGLVAAIMVAVLFGVMVAAQAAGVDVFGAVARWTEETFHFSVPEAGAADMWFADYQEELEAAGLSAEYLPTWLPEGYEVELIEAYDTGTIKDIYLLLQGKEGSSIDFFISIHQTPESMESTIFEKDEAPVRTVQMDGRDIYFFENLDSQRAVSQYQNIIYALSGDISEQIVLGILSSIGG